MTANPTFDIRAIAREHGHRALPMMDQHINPAMAAVLKTIGFDANYTKGQGAYLFDDQGRRIIDCLGGYAVFAAGRNHPVIRKALQDAMDLDLPNLPGVGAPKLAGLLAQQLTLIAPGSDGVKPGPLDTVFFASGGSEAVEAAIKFARHSTGRSGLVYCHRSYHGLSMGSLSVCGNHEFRDGFGNLLGQTAEIPFNDLESLEKALRNRDVAAFIVEPIQGKGVNVPNHNYLREAHALCQKSGTLLIADEIQTGLGRTGKMFACEHFGVIPDILVIAKALSGGFVPTSAVILPRAVHAATFSSMKECSKIQTTYGMNDLSMVAGLATLHVLRTERLVENARDVGDYLMAALRRDIGDMSMVSDVRGKGLMVAIEFQAPPRTSLTLRAGWELVHKMDANLFCQAVIMPLFSDHNILAQVAGHRLDVIKLIPPLVLSKADADEISAGFKATVGACHKFPGPLWEIGRKLGSAALKRFSGATSTVEPVGQSR